ncbi:sorting assembly machinery 50 kDa subunit [[Candida] railenensis]|uniref:Sorting assembly machinery 50 kDa subunit n=1 Tax=[Candida] railenensis TaxID=45579 RepID=A0A9P0QS75_9ASCO|nr:sorting assembly machinery 50 kDa subunit [[Candida] railenensis]
MSLDHDSMVDRLSSSNSPKSDSKSRAQEQLEKWTQKKQELMLSQNREYMESLFKQNATKPIKIGPIQVINSQGFRDSFIEAQIDPLTQTNLVTLGTFFSKLDQVSSNWKNSGAVENMFIQLQDSKEIRRPQPFFRSGRQTGGDGTGRAGSTIISPIIHLAPVKRFYAKTGTNVGNGEGDGYIQFQLKNLFGGAENLTFDATTGTKTQSSYLLNYTQPIWNNTNLRMENVFYMNTRNLDWLKCEATVRGHTIKVSHQSLQNRSVNLDFSIENCWRTVSNSQSRALDVMLQSGNDFKSSALFNWKYDTRDNAHLPMKGHMVRIGLEYSGLIPSVSSYKFFKSVWEQQHSFKVSDVHSVILTNKAGVISPLGGSLSTTHILDRFYIGGPNDVRSFLLNGLGPKSFNSSIGGDLFVNGGVSLVSKIPRLDPESNFKIHNFFNFGKLIPMEKSDHYLSTLKSLSQVSASYGFGILYNHPMARFELNFVLPLITHDRDYVRKGIQYGIGVSFL